MSNPTTLGGGAALPLLASLLLLSACAGGQAPRANCFSFAAAPGHSTVSTMGAEVTRAADPCDFTLIGGVE